MEDEQLSSKIDMFSAQFCQELSGRESAVSSPLSAELVLALLALGARGVSHDQILDALHLPDDDFIRSEFAAISAKLSSIKGVTFNIANKVYLMEGPYELKPQFKSDAVQVFGTDVEKIDFNTGAAAANTINKWVEGRTKDRIKDLLSSDSVDADTRLVLVNALYFKGSWKERFDPEETRDMPFHVSSTQTISIPFMYMKNYFKFEYNQELVATLLEMPYEGEEARLLVVLPNEVDGLDGLLERLAMWGFRVAGRGSTYRMEVFLPKFKIETEIDLKVLLPKLGIKAIFEPRECDLPGVLDKQEPLYVSQAVQKAFFEVNEEGTEAAAAASGPVLRPPRFVADHPFYFALLLGDTQLFSGCFRPSQ